MNRKLWKMVLWLLPVFLFVVWFLPVSFVEPPAFLVGWKVNLGLLVVLGALHFVGFGLVVAHKDKRSRYLL